MIAKIASATNSSIRVNARWELGPGPSLRRSGRGDELVIPGVAETTMARDPIALLRHIGGQSRQHPVRVARVAHCEVDAADRRVGRVVHGFVDHQREAALLCGEACGGDGGEDAPRTQLGYAVLRGPGGEQALAGLE